MYILKNSIKFVLYDKYFMQYVIGKKNNLLKYSDKILSDMIMFDNAQEAAKWLDENGFKYPILTKKDKDKEFGYIVRKVNFGNGKIENIYF